MLGPLLTYQELTDYLCGVTLTEDDLPRLISTLKYYQDRLADLAPIINSLEGGSSPRRVLHKPASWVTPPRSKRRKLALDELRRREGNSYTAIAALHTFLSPIRRLPSEMLTEIFVRCLPQTPFVSPGDSGSPLNLMRVCSQWYKICISSPRLWSSIELNSPMSNPSELLDVWLSRSGDVSLSLCIQGHLLTDGRVQRLLGMHAKRLQHIQLILPEKDSCMLPDCEYPLLTSVEIQSPRGLQLTSVNNLSDIARRTPSLRRFTWRSTTSNVLSPPAVSLQWGNITHLTLQTTLTKQKCIDILAQATNAIQLEFGSISSLGPTSQTPRITLPKLSYLSMHSFRDISQIFDALTLPHLTTLIISSLSWPHASVLDLFQRSRFPLQNLVIFHAPISESALVECLDAVHGTIMELTVQGGDTSAVTDALLDRFTPKATDDVFCARLEGVAFYNCMSCSPGALARMVRSRLPDMISGDRMTFSVSGGDGEKQTEPRFSPFRVVELYKSDPEIASLKPLRSLGLKLIAYSDDGLKVVEIEQDDTS